MSDDHGRLFERTAWRCRGGAPATGIRPGATPSSSRIAVDGCAASSPLYDSRETGSATRGCMRQVRARK